MIDRRPDPVAVREHLKQMLASRMFVASKRLCLFLTYVVEQTLEGRGNEIKEYVIAAEVYGRGTEYDPQVDSTVRVEASRLRAKLRDYYAGPGASSRCRITLPKGTYAPVIERTEEPAVLPAPARYDRTNVIVAALACLLLVAGIAITRTTTRPGVVSAATASGTPSDPALLDQYLQADQLLRKQVLQDGWPGRVPPTVAQAIVVFEDLTRKAPDYAKAWSGLAEAREWAYELDKDHPQSRLDAARAAAERAVSIDPTLADAHSRLAALYLWSYGDVDRAHKANLRAMELNPRDARAQARHIDVLRMRGQFQEALSATNKALTTEPSSARLWAQKGLVMYDLDRYQDAIDATTHALQLNSGNHLNQAAIAHWVRGLALQQQGILDRAEAEFRAGLAISPQDDRNQPALGNVLAQQGRTEQARSVLNSLLAQEANGKKVNFGVALVYAGLGDTAQAQAWLSRSSRFGEGSYLFANIEKRLKDIANNKVTAG